MSKNILNFTHIFVKFLCNCGLYFVLLLLKQNNNINSSNLSTFFHRINFIMILLKSVKKILLESNKKIN